MDQHPLNFDGELEALAKALFSKFEEVRLKPYGIPASWDAAEQGTRQAWMTVAQFVDSMGQWKSKLRQYGRHLPSCPIGAPCQCGFEEIEKSVY